MASIRTNATAVVALIAAGCTPGVGEITVTKSDTTPSVAFVEWTTDEPTVGYVEFSDGDLVRRTASDAEPTTEHRHQLVALAPEQEIVFRVLGDRESDEGSFTTDALEGNVPPVEVEGTGQDRFAVLPLLANEQQFPVVIDPQGRIVWIYRDPLPLQVFRSRLSLDGSGIVYSSVLEGGDAAPGSQIVRVSWEGEVLETFDVDYLAHDFVELADGTLVSLAAEFRGEGKDEFEGNKLVSIAPDGTVEDIWSTWDCFDPVTHPSDDPNRPGEWTHANALDYDEARDAFVISFRNLGTLAHIDRQTGDCDWAFGGTGGDVTVTGPRFRFQHQFEWTADGMLVFDNQGAQGQVSRVLEYSFDPAAKTAQFVADLRATPPLFTFILGDVHRLEDGDLMVVWGDTGIMDRLGADGTREWRLSMVNNVNLGFAEFWADPGRPSER